MELAKYSSLPIILRFILLLTILQLSCVVSSQTNSNDSSSGVFTVKHSSDSDSYSKSAIIARCEMPIPLPFCPTSSPIIFLHYPRSSMPNLLFNLCLKYYFFIGSLSRRSNFISSTRNEIIHLSIHCLLVLSHKGSLSIYTLCCPIQIHGAVSCRHVLSMYS